ncbi:hypothetical protein SETIT_5G110900v2 [Setaria italica]|uniref:Uncharacterized protein n=1 Tax=Setaria italica TaxID=4555 RepID=A0A368R3I3_SETIT|nr:hypothetical protein SETIT_5G110900v2 [Setaria italica]
MLTCDPAMARGNWGLSPGNIYKRPPRLLSATPKPPNPPIFPFPASPTNNKPLCSKSTRSLEPPGLSASLVTTTSGGRDEGREAKPSCTPAHQEGALDELFDLR